MPRELHQPTPCSIRVIFYRHRARHSCDDDTCAGLRSVSHSTGLLVAILSHLLLPILLGCLTLPSYGRPSPGHEISSIRMLPLLVTHLINEALMSTAGKNAYLRLRQAMMACTSVACRSQRLLWLNLRSTESKLERLERTLKSHVAKQCTLLSSQAAHLRGHLASLTELARAADLTTAQAKNHAMDSTDLVEAMALSQSLPTESLLQASLAGDENLWAASCTNGLRRCASKWRILASIREPCDLAYISEATTLRALDGTAISLQSRCQEH